MDDLEKDLCKKCVSNKFGENGVALTKGLKFFECTICKKSSANYAAGQTWLCQSCCDKIGKCVICGELK